jgi:hypothetical protein
VQRELRDQDIDILRACLLLPVILALAQPFFTSFRRDFWASIYLRMVAALTFPAVPV